MSAPILSTKLTFSVFGSRSVGWPFKTTRPPKRDFNRSQVAESQTVFLCSCGVVAAQCNGMEPRVSVFAGINIIGAVQAACLGVVLLTWRRHNLQANRLLGALAL